MHEQRVATTRIDASEMIGIAGFSAMIAWVILSFFWLFPHATFGINAIEGRVLQSLIYLGLPLGYLLQHLISRFTGRKLVSRPVLAVGTVIGFGEPAMCFAYSYNVDTPLVVVGIVNLLTGIVASEFIVAWLDACTRARWSNAARFCAYSMLGGGIVAACAAFSAQPAASIIAALCVVISAFLTRYTYVSFSADEPGDTAASEAKQLDAAEVRDMWGNPYEIEPAFGVFGVSFGFAFQQVVATGSTPLLASLLCGFAGIAVVCIMAMRGVRTNVTVLMRVVVCVVVLYCVSLQFIDLTGRIVLTGLVVAAWVALVSSNYALIIDKCELESVAFCMYAPVRLVIRATGFAVGWTLAAGLATAFGDFSTAQAVAGIVIAFAAVVVVMLFYPQKDHHISYEEERPKKQRVVFVRDADAPTKRGLFERRCDAVSELYSLSPRESEVLRYLARGRNAAYIEKELCISQNTVKTHVRKVYNKLDIHSQQNLMDFIESYPIED